MVIIILMFRQGDGDSGEAGDCAMSHELAANPIIKSRVFWLPVLLSSNRRPIQSLMEEDKKQAAKLMSFFKNGLGQLSLLAMILPQMPSSGAEAPG